jgi:PAS domain S-box-containing protein
MMPDSARYRCCGQSPESRSRESVALHVAQVAHFYHQGIGGIRGSLIAATLLTVSLWETVPYLRLIAWFLLYAGACGIGEWLYRGFRREEHLEATVDFWRKRFVILSIAGGILWGAVPLFLFPHDSIYQQALETFILGGMSVGIVISHGALSAGHVPFILLVYTPLIGRYLYEGSDTQITMGILLLVFLMYLIGAASRMRDSLTESFNLRCRHQGLLEVLKREKAGTDQLNETLRLEVRERRQAEQALLESEERFHKLYAMSPYPMVVHDEKIVLSANPASAKLIGAPSAEALMGQSIWTHLHPDSFEKTRDGINKLAENRDAVQFSDLSFVTSDGCVVDVEVVSVPTRYKGTPAILAVGRDVTESRRSDEQLKRSLVEKEVLLREIHHRVKNNLQVISSLMRLQARYAGGKSLDEIFSETQERLLSMALIHEKLYNAENMAKIDFQAYVHTLVQHVFHAAGATDSRIALRKNTEKVCLGLESAIPCGLIVNELVSNAIKHGFPDGRSGWIGLSLSQNDQGVEIAVADNGVGLPEDTDYSEPRTLGLRLVQTLVRQIEGELDVTVSEGTEFRIRFQINKDEN